MECGICFHSGRAIPISASMITDRPTLQPGVITWFKIYSGVLCFIYLCLAAASLIFFLVPPEQLEMSATAARLMGATFLGCGLLFFGVCVLPFLVRPRPWVWGYGLGLTWE